MISALTLTWLVSHMQTYTVWRRDIIPSFWMDPLSIEDCHSLSLWTPCTGRCPISQRGFLLLFDTVATLLGDKHSLPHSTLKRLIDPKHVHVRGRIAKEELLDVT